ncbi:DUF7322 domain-containing protein [Halobiforma nitratireducens]|uniref:DUF7322 domain-containing protein n=1 Tax=Halobiforma nitratireducens JCM 10879 TaxID=1227454 RepID=M0LTD0_9EURY|nr:hypothetical protein [Halobiforma nitratireducens]EMA35649.1 hypothetical protein C446_12022 [Halobiforma nitratireducens JCM 10879]
MPDPSDDDPLEDPLAGDPLDDPLEGDPLDDPLGGDPLEDPFGSGSDGSESEADDDIADALGSIERATLLAFVTVGALVHGGVLAASLGVMLIGFRGQWVVGGVLAAAGVGALALSVVVYRRYRVRQEA